ncbi:MAG: AraC family transcriptional regulator [Candidatus Dormibacteraeota bacterium]|nr:AraC family transcriptional regulator [Candidatus Dormibacteraeota bacterium]
MLSLRIAEVAPGGDFRAAFTSLRARGRSVTLHDHDFHEVMWVVAGSGTHVVAEGALPLREGDLVLVRPRDRHRIEVATHGKLDFVNVAFRSELWWAFTALARNASAARAWDESETTPIVHLDEPERSRFTADVDQVLQAHDKSRAHDSPGGQSGSTGSQLALLQFLGAVVRQLVPESTQPSEGDRSDEPGWLSQACRAIREPENLQAGYDRFVSLSGVSRGHLARALRRHRGLTPAQFITQLRLRRAALLLEITRTPVGEVALESGFDNISYFHRRFRERFGRTPRAFRLDARRRLVP